MNVTLDTNQLKAEFAQLDRYLKSEKFLTVFEPAFDKALKHILGGIKKEMPVGVTGKARNDLTTLTLKELGRMQGRVMYKDGSDALAYAEVIEGGRRPGTFPDMSIGGAFHKWCALKIRQAHRKKTGKMMSKKSLAKVLDGIMYVIGRSIKEKGIKGRHPFEKGWLSTREQAYRIIQFGVSRGLDAMAK